MDRLRATTSTGAVVDRPTAEQLSALVIEVERSGRGAFLVIERRSGATTSYLQARRVGTSWVLEQHDGDPGPYCRAETADAGSVYAAVAYWVLRARPLPGLSWQDPRPAPLAATG